VLTESVFAWPRRAAGARRSRNRDMPLINGCILLFATFRRPHAWSLLYAAANPHPLQLMLEISDDEFVRFAI